jgi:hypothetical protein
LREYSVMHAYFNNFQGVFNKGYNGSPFRCTRQPLFCAAKIGVFPFWHKLKRNYCWFGYALKTLSGIMFCKG